MKNEHKNLSHHKKHHGALHHIAMKMMNDGHHHREHHADGGQAALNMPPMAMRRAAPNLDQRFKSGGRAGGGQMSREDHLMAEGTYSPHGGELMREDRRRARGGAMHHRKRHSRYCD